MRGLKAHDNSRYLIPFEKFTELKQNQALPPRVKTTELLLEVDQWTNFTEHFTHLKSNEIAEDKTLLLTAILAGGINLGLSKMSESCPGVTYSKLSWLQDWHIRDETYSAALAVLTNAQLKQPFGMMHLLGFKLAPRIRNLSEIKLFSPPKQNKNYTALQTMISSEEIIKNNWDEIQRLAVSIQQGSATASLLLRKLSNYPRQNGLALALREIGRIERTLFILDWLENVGDLRQRVTDGLNKGESRNALARAVFFNRLGEIRDRSYQQQAYRAGGLALVTSAIVLWNTVYMEKSVQLMSERGDKFEPDWCKHLSPLGWEHIGLTGDYVWKLNDKKL